MKNAILGISAYYHDSAAVVLVDGKIAAAAHEERFTRKKHDYSFPLNAIRYVLEETGVEYKDLNSIAFYDKPFLKFERLLETYHAFAPRGYRELFIRHTCLDKRKAFHEKTSKRSTFYVG